MMNLYLEKQRLVYQANLESPSLRSLLKRLSIAVLLFISLFLLNVQWAEASVWSVKAPMTSPRHDFAAAVGADQNGVERIYVIGGVLDPKALNSVEAYDPISNSWTTMAPMLQGRIRPRAAAVTATNGKIYVFGGEIGNQRVDMVDEYDPSTNTWTVKLDMPFPLPARSLFAAAAGQNGKIYVFGGSTNSATLNRVDEYDPVNDSWTQKANMPTPRSSLAATTGQDGLIYVTGGNNFNVLEVYNPNTNTWTTKTPMPISNISGHGSATACNGKIYVMGTSSINGTPAHVLKYDINGDSWTSITPTMPSGGRTGLAVVSLNKYIYAIGGYRRFGNPPGTQTTNDAYGPLCSPLSVSLDTFTANAADGKITINWTTGTETNNAGFTLWRATPIDGQCSTDPYNYKDVKQVQPLVYSKAEDGVLGASYSEPDQNVEPDVTYCYGLEDVDYNGKRTFHVDKIISARLN